MANEFAGFLVVLVVLALVLVGVSLVGFIALALTLGFLFLGRVIWARWPW